ncbi:interleukin-7 isoform X2 [Ahaetulla prasina]|uniref:interleukin-7 isoform X2 n=1 Tax=Ahaetulla prasina TaxID=499056 RepID=UPI0026485294|nr:interleukin-7 isoform X2 [Ahaetulla prasina]
MSHASLRCIFMILPLFLVLVPEASSDNMTEIRNDYENILINMINHLETLINQNISSCKTRICSSCSPENTTIIGLTSCLKIKANCTKIFPELKNKMISVSELTTKILNKNGYTLQPLNHSQCYRQCRKYIRKCDSTDTLCCLKNAVAALRSWWQKFLYHGYS